MGWQHWCSTICEGSCYTLHRRGPVMLSKAWKDKSRYHWNGVQNKLYLFSKAPYEVSTGRTEYRFIKSLSGNCLRWQNVICSPLLRTCVRWLERTFPQLDVSSQTSSDLLPKGRAEEPKFHSASEIALVFPPCVIFIDSDSSRSIMTYTKPH